MTDALADDFMKPLREAQTRLDQIKAEIVTNNKIIASQKLEIDRGTKRMAELSQQEMDLHKAIQAAKAELVRVQQATAHQQSLWEEYHNKLLKLAG
jgi:hypothetical protein